MPKEGPDIYGILESFLRDNFSSKYGPKDLDDLVNLAKKLLRQAIEGQAKKEQAGGVGLAPRKPTYVREADIEVKLAESLKQTVKKGEGG